MEANDLVIDAFGRVQGIIRRSLNGLTREQLLYRPGSEANSIAWLVWHLTRIQDHHLSALADRPQAWVSEGWHAQFDMPANADETGRGHTPEQVAALQPSSAEVLQGYYDAVYERTKEYVQGLGQADFDVVLNEPQYDPLPTVGVRLVSVISDNTQHAGQAAYLKGLVLSLG